MAQTKKVSSTPTKTNSSSTATKKQPTTAEMREWYEKNKSRLEKYEDANNALKNLRDISKSKTYKSISTFSKENLRTYLQNISSNEKNLRNLSRYLWYRSQVYFRLINYCSNMFVLNARSVIPNINLTEENNPEDVLTSYYDTLSILDRMGLSLEMLKCILVAFREDVSYNCVYFDEKSDSIPSMFCLPLDPDYMKIAGYWENGEFAEAMNMSYFRSNQDLLEYWGEPFQSLYSTYQSTGEKWQVIPQEYSLCLKFRAEDWETVVPPFCGLFNALISLQDLEDIQAIASEQEIYKLIVATIPTISGADDPDSFAVDPNLAIDYFNRLLEAIPSYTDAIITPIPVDCISFNNDAASDTNKVQEATKTVLNTSGGAQILNSASISGAEAFRSATRSDTEFAISSLLPQIERFVNRFIRNYVKNPARVKFFETSAYTISDFRKELLENGQNGLPTQLAVNACSGFSEYETMALNFLEQDCLKIGEKFKPMTTSYVQSGKSGKEESDVSELTDSGAETRDKEKNKM